MSGPLDGTRVVELGLWVAGPSAAAILCDWGADVIKIEPPQGDPFRGWSASMLGVTASINPPFEMDNRGKRSVALNLERGEAREIALQLLERADVFVTNTRPRVLNEFGLSYEELSQRYPRLVYCQITGYGADSPERDRAAYDIGAFWARAGVAAALTPEGAQLPQQRPHGRPGSGRGRLRGAPVAGEDGQGPARGRVPAPYRGVHDGLGRQPGLEAKAADSAVRPYARRQSPDHLLSVQ